MVEPQDMDHDVLTVFGKRDLTSYTRVGCSSHLGGEKKLNFSIKSFLAKNVNIILIHVIKPLRQLQS